MDFADAGVGFHAQNGSLFRQTYVSADAPSQRRTPNTIDENCLFPGKLVFAK
jgi:hypothetical protein